MKLKSWTFPAIICLLVPRASMSQVPDPYRAGSLGWNLLFGQGTTNSQRLQSIKDVENSLTRGILANCTGCRITFVPVVICPCDSNLVNLNAVVTNGSGQSVTPPPPPPPPTGGSGNPLLGFSTNLGIETDLNPSVSDSVNTHNLIYLPPKPKAAKQIVAILDTGLDSALISGIRPLLFKDPKRSTLYNFLEYPSQPRNILVDDHPYKHGTVVAGLLLQAMSRTKVFPRIMVLKVLNKNKAGSTFSVSCAISYAIQNHVSVINASLGYYLAGNNGEDMIFKHYVDSATKIIPEPILFVAAAGNDRTQPHNQNALCTPSPGRNELSSAHRFLPACYSLRNDHIITITGISNIPSLTELQSACRYQNFSNVFVSAGVVNSGTRPATPPVSDCCQYSVPFKSDPYEGSSFATPVFTGWLMNQVLNFSVPLNAPAVLDKTKHAATLTNTTVNGNYIVNPTQ